MIETLLVLVLGLIPSIFSLWVTRRAEIQARERLKAVMEATATIGIQSSRLPLDQYPTDVSYLIGDASCRFNAHSAYIQCAVNPLGLCQECPDYEQKLSS